ncbi:hypothetical protein REPUB_Repub07fG0184400 [Reevesia pubescens]
MDPGLNSQPFTNCVILLIVTRELQRSHSSAFLLLNQIQKFSIFADVEKKVEKTLKLIKRRNRGKKEPELVGLVEDFHKQYQTLFAQYDNLKRESGKRAVDGKGNESAFYASNSDSEYYSSEDIEINTNTTFNNNRRMADNIKEELGRAYAEVADLKHQLASKTEEKEALASDHLAALNKIQEIETINRNLRKEVDEKEKRLSPPGKVHKGMVTVLGQLTGLKTVLGSVHHQKTDLEPQFDDKTVETNQTGETNKALYVHILGEGDEVNKLMKQIKDNENNLTSKIEDSMAQVCNLKKEVDNLRAQKCDAEGGIACKSNQSFDEANVMKQELDALRSQKSESEILIERKSKEISQYLIEVKTLKEELARKSDVEQILVEEKEGLQVQVMDLESEVDALRKQKNTSEGELRNNISELNQLREEKGHLNARILELEALLREGGLETSQITALNSEVELLKQQIDFMKMERSQLELKIANQQIIAKEREESTNKSLESNSKLVKRLSLGNKFNYHVLERKMEDLAQEFRKKLEDNIRLLYQRITVAEKIHYENKESYKKIKEQLEKENGALGEKLATCEAEFRKLRDTTEWGKNATTVLHSMVNKSDNNGNPPTRISKVVDELVSSNECETAEVENGTKQVKSNVDLLVAEMDKENENQEELLRDKVLNLEAKLSEEEEEKLKLLKAVSELENRVGELEKITKEKHEIMLGREEEKREAIRQLCLLVDYQRSRCDYLKELISKLTVRIKTKT